MEFLNLGDQYKPPVAWWNRALKVIPRANFERLIFDFTYQNGVMSGLEIVPDAPASLNVRIKAGRAVVRDTATARALVIDNIQEQVFSLASSVPPGTATTVKLVVRYFLNDSLEASVPVSGAPALMPDGSQHEDHDPAFVAYLLKPLERDSSTIHVTGAPLPGDVVIGEVTLSAGQTQITTAHISYTNRENATYQETVKTLQGKINDLRADFDAYKVGISGNITALQTLVGVPMGIPLPNPAASVPTNFLLCAGQLLDKTVYTALFSVIGYTWGNDPLNVNNFKLPDLRQRTVFGAGGPIGLATYGGSASVTLLEAQLPIFTPSGSAVAVGDHVHGGQTNNDGSHSHYLRGDGSANGGSGSWAPLLTQATSWNDYAGGPTGGTPPTSGTNPADSSPNAAAGAAKDAVPANDTEHIHAFVTAAAGAHGHGLSMNSIGGNQAHENMPPYAGMNWIIRVT